MAKDSVGHQNLILNPITDARDYLSTPCRDVACNVSTPGEYVANI
ncbi:hypothetical protein PL8927_690185 [Planktothrix serta PCC 8927]|uniref:Uncharacterized protein n=1 Tax=Planktothrix serta PCC 8927 TaxID=671068 RepID=A0A7Z9BT61_9CYAN|nr:hypothetical protein PL8927_690185 [Planktothrix serta PCC 8927]